MKITKYTHACVRIERDGSVLVIDPGNFSEPEAVDGADAVIITHGHADHLEPDHVVARVRGEPRPARAGAGRRRRGARRARRTR